MSLLSTFGIMFETDAEKAKREVDGVNNSLSATESTANTAASSMDGFGASTNAIAGSLFGLTDSLSSVDSAFLDTDAAAGIASASISNFSGDTSSATNMLGGFTAGIDDVGSALDGSSESITSATSFIDALADSASDAIGDLFGLSDSAASLDDVNADVSINVGDFNVNDIEVPSIDIESKIQAPDFSSFKIPEVDASDIDFSSFKIPEVDGDLSQTLNDIDDGFVSILGSSARAKEGINSFADSVDSASGELPPLNNNADQAGSALDDLDESVNDSSTSFGIFTKQLGLAAAGILSVTGLVAGLVTQATSTDEIGKFSETLGLSIEEVGAWGEAVKRSGGDAASFRGSLEGLNGQLTDISLTGGGEAAEIFARLGVNAVDAQGKIKGAFDVLPELADSFQNLSKAEAVGFGQKLGLDQGTILLLQQGRVAVEDLVNRQKQLGVATQEDYLAAAQFNDAWADTQQVFSNLFTSAGTTVLPMLTTMLKGLENIVGWVKQNQSLVTGFFIGVAGVITAVYLPAIASAATATLIAAAPFIAIGLAVAAVGAAFAILYEDVVAYLGGQESFIGDLAKEYEWFGKIVDSVINGVKFALKTFSDFAGEMFDNVKLAAEFLGPILTKIFGGISDSFGSLGVDMGSVVDLIIAAFSMLGDAISKTLSFIASPIETTKEAINDIKNLLPGIGDELEDAFSGAKSFFGFGDDEIQAGMNKALEVNAAISNNPLNGQTSASIVNSQQSVSRTNNINVGATTVNTQATDANEVANRVSGNFNDQMKMAVGQLTDAEDY